MSCWLVLDGMVIMSSAFKEYTEVQKLRAADCYYNQSAFERMWLLFPDLFPIDQQRCCTVSHTVLPNGS